MRRRSPGRRFRGRNPGLGTSVFSNSAQPRAGWSFLVITPIGFLCVKPTIRLPPENSTLATSRSEHPALRSFQADYALAPGDSSAVKAADASRWASDLTASIQRCCCCTPQTSTSTASTASRCHHLADTPWRSELAGFPTPLFHLFVSPCGRLLRPGSSLPSLSESCSIQPVRRWLA